MLLLLEDELCDGAGALPSVLLLVLLLPTVPLFTEGLLLPPVLLPPLLLPLKGQVVLAGAYLEVG